MADYKRYNKDNTADKLLKSDVKKLLNKAFILLDERKWDEADSYFEEVLEIDTHNAYACLGRLLAELKIRKKEKLKFCTEPFDDNFYYKKAIRYGDEKLVEELKNYQKLASEKAEQHKIESEYNKAVHLTEKAQCSSDYFNAVKIFESLSGYKNSDALAKSSRKKAEIERKSEIYSNTVDFLKNNAKEVEDYRWAIEQFRSIPGWLDADEHIEICEGIIRELEEEEQDPVIKAIRETEISRMKKVNFIKKRILPIFLIFALISVIVLIIELAL